MHYLISGREYRPESALHASLNIWRRVLVEQGVGLKTVVEDIRTIKSPLDILEDVKLLKSFQVFIWVLRLAAGEDVTYDEAGDVALDELKIVVEDKDTAADPKAPEASAPAAKRGKSGTSRTSRPRSTSTSSSSPTTGPA